MKWRDSSYLYELFFFNCICERLFSVLKKAVLTRGSDTPDYFQVFPTMQQSGFSVLAAAGRPHPVLHSFQSPSRPSSSLFICPSFCSAAASEVSHTESSITRTSLLVFVCVCVCETSRLKVRVGRKCRKRVFVCTEAQSSNSNLYITSFSFYSVYQSTTNLFIIKK